MIKNLVFVSIAMALSGCATTSELEASLKTIVCDDDPALCRMIVTANQVYALKSDNMNPDSPDAIIMKYDLVDDPRLGNAVDRWISATDAAGESAYQYTRASGPLGQAGALGAFGPLSWSGFLSKRFRGTVPSLVGASYDNNWCNVPSDQSDIGCVYGSQGPLGETGALNPSSYYYTMYHLQEDSFWRGNHNHNLDSTGVWGIQGPLGPSGPFGALGPLGPLGISLQLGMTTTTDGVYKAGSTIVRQTRPIRYGQDAAVWRTYNLYEMYSKQYAQQMGTGCGGCEVNDTSFAVDASFNDPTTTGDSYLFTSQHNQFVLLNVVPVNAWNDYGLQLYVSNDGGTTYTLLATSNSNVYADGGGLMDFIVIRAKQGEMFRANVTLQAGLPFYGYYLFTTGSGVGQATAGATAADADLWSSRLQSNGTRRFNIFGAHQQWVPW
ncbi:hypothetical protein NHH73_28505 [Oxalobacteraceae bacterium OTU3CINTB1]|nr:hypothetical protein NHH73_28505 [Oxalobacteraceae bacterium OTU3CINTB1]